jgi:hypothetical protein
MTIFEVVKRKHLVGTDEKRNSFVFVQFLYVEHKSMVFFPGIEKTAVIPCGIVTFHVRCLYHPHSLGRCRNHGCHSG